jgi:competence protein ComGC
MKLSTRGRPRLAFTMMELLAIVVVLVLVVAFLIPRMGTLRRRVIDEGCRDNLRVIGVAFRLWPDNVEVYPALTSTNRGGTMELADRGQVFIHFRAMSNELADVKYLVCPADREKVIAPGFGNDLSDTNVSYFVGLDATVDDPTSFLVGDRNLATTNSQRLPPGLFVMGTNSLLTWTGDFHRGRGNIGSADGSVQFLDRAGLLTAIRESRLATNRLAIP